jgi:acetyl esterase
MRPILNAMRERIAARGPLKDLDFANMRRQAQNDLERWNNLASAHHHEEIILEGAFGPTAALLVTQSERAARNGTIVWCHGGGFVMGSPETHLSLAASLAHATACQIVMLRYALAPEQRYPAAIVDVAVQVQSLRVRCGIGDRKFVLGGDSAGAYVALAAKLDHSDIIGPLAAFIGIYGTYRPPIDAGSYAVFAENFGLSAAAMQFFWTTWMGGRPDDATLDLTIRDLADIPASYLMGAGLDPLRDDTRRLAHALADCGVDTVFSEIPGVTHGCAHMDTALESVRRAYARIGYFVRDKLMEQNR